MKSTHLRKRIVAALLAVVLAVSLAAPSLAIEETGVSKSGSNGLTWEEIDSSSVQVESPIQANTSVVEKTVECRCGGRARPRAEAARRKDEFQDRLRRCPPRAVREYKNVPGCAASGDNYLEMKNEGSGMRTDKLQAASPTVPACVGVRHAAPGDALLTSTGWR